MNFYVLGPRVEAETGQRVQSVGERFLTGARQNEVDVRDSDVVRPDVDLFHSAGKCPGTVYELGLRSGRRVTTPPCFYGLSEGTQSFPARRFGATSDERVSKGRFA